ncbi:MAG: glycosyltransferase family 2 protein [Candidatus Omnitrophica bacterium]|nr:glycosyltransferase family 2 protein [Candidatus Omnitrophota bacterium]
MKISVVMATLNEEGAIRKVIEDIKTATSNQVEIVVVDSSTDKTAEIAESLGAKVIRQARLGYGTALKAAFKAASGDVIFTTDCDDTYPMEAIPEFLSWFDKGYDIVSGSRMVRKNKAMPPMNKFGNWLFALLARVLYKIDITDITTGMRGYRRKILGAYDWESNLAFPAELVIRPVLGGYKFKEIPIDYRLRIGEVTLNPLKSGLAFIRCIFKYKFNLKISPDLL